MINALKISLAEKNMRLSNNILLTFSRIVNSFLFQSGDSRAGCLGAGLRPGWGRGARLLGKGQGSGGPQGQAQGCDGDWDLHGSISRCGASEGPGPPAAAPSAVKGKVVSTVVSDIWL